MVERIRKLLEFKRLSPTQFADAISVARPIVSHILSGRNKPSLDVVQRILAAMPDLSTAWLLNGTEPMLTPVAPSFGSVISGTTVSMGVTEAAEAKKTSSAPPVRNVVASFAPTTDTNGSPLESNQLQKKDGVLSPEPTLRRFAPAGPRLASGGEPANALISPNHFRKGKPPTIEPEQAVLHHVAATATEPEVPPKVGGEVGSVLAEKRIRRIVIFYHNGSFADYQPE